MYEDVNRWIYNDHSKSNAQHLQIFENCILFLQCVDTSLTNKISFSIIDLLLRKFSESSKCTAFTVYIVKIVSDECV